ncbi:MAG: peptidase C39 family protein [Chromatocurvus sp.]
MKTSTQVRERAPAQHYQFRPADERDLDALVRIEELAYRTDRLSRRSFRRWVGSDHAALIVAENTDGVAAYALVLLHRGTRLARLYSIAVDPASMGRGLGLALLQAAENAALDAGRIDMRLEVRRDNANAIALYEKQGYRRFGEYADYYEDHEGAYRYQKRIRTFDPRLRHHPVPWYRQTTEFTCGPASLMMAMRAQDADYLMSRAEELRLWRESTTIYMTSGHGGCHPLGLALAAHRRGFNAEVWISLKTPLFIDSVRNEGKRAVVEQVHRDYVDQSREAGLSVNYCEVTQTDLDRALKAGAVPVVLISTWQMDRKRSPHWVVVSAIDDQFIYLHDPDPEEILQNELDCQYLPIARDDFERMARFGRDRLRAALIIWPNTATSVGSNARNHIQ